MSGVDSGFRAKLWELWQLADVPRGQPPWRHQPRPGFGLCTKFSAALHECHDKPLFRQLVENSHWGTSCLGE